MQSSIRPNLLLILVSACLAFFVAAYLKTKPAPLDLTRPVPREQVLTLFKELFSMPAADYLNWEEAAEAGRIPAHVRAFHEQIVAFNTDSAIDPSALSIEGLPFVDLPDGPRVYPVLKPTLGPQIGANVSQEDLNTLLQEQANLQRRVSALEAQLADRDPPGGSEFVAVHLSPEDLSVARVQAMPAPNTVPFEVAEGGEPEVLHVEFPPPLDGRHIMAARLNTASPVSIHLKLTEEGSEILADVTGESAGKIFAILIRGEFHAAIAVGGQMNTRYLQLPGSFTREKAQIILDSWTERSRSQEARLPEL